MNGRPAAYAVLYPKGEDAEEKEEAGHSEAHFVDGRVSHQSLAVFSCIHFLTQFTVEGDLMGKTRDKKEKNRLDYRGSGQRPTSAYVCIECGFSERPNSVCSLCHSSKRSRKREQAALSPWSLPSFILGFLQPVRGALKLTGSVQKQRPQMNTFNVCCY